MPRSPAPPVAKLRPSRRLARLGALELCGDLDTQGATVCSVCPAGPGTEFVSVVRADGMTEMITVYSVSDEERA